MKKHLYQEVYIVGVDSTVSAHGEITVCPTFECLLTYLKTKNISVNSDLRVLHGTLTSAKSIPKDLKGRQPFIILLDPDDGNLGILLDSDTDDAYDELAAEVEATLDNPEVATFFFEIGDVFILYGYELSLTFAVDEDDLDEDIIADCLTISKAAKELANE
jgi:hypothetical protein